MISPGWNQLWQYRYSVGDHAGIMAAVANARQLRRTEALRAQRQRDLAEADKSIVERAA